ncbi:hypothetical protein ACA910_013143 [Epithemia clementina (nom. ined.)]
MGPLSFKMFRLPTAGTSRTILALMKLSPTMVSLLMLGLLWAQCGTVMAAEESSNGGIDSLPLRSDDHNNLVTLPLGDINLLVVTDVHSWVAGHNVDHEPYWNVDYGTVLSYYITLQNKIAALNAANKDGKELFFVMNGDFMDGTGLSLYVDRLFPILQRMPFSAINLGNHELFFDDNLLAMRDKGFIDYWQGNYLTSNTVWSDTKLPIGNRFTYLSSKNSNKNILVFGFLYNFGGACSAATVERVEDVIQQPWFTNVLTFNSSSVDSTTTTSSSGQKTRILGVSSSRSEENYSDSYKDYDAIVVMAHMGYQDPLIDVIRAAIRSITGNDKVPIQFIAGHTHTRGYAHLDEMSTSFEAGKFLDTIGFVSFPWEKEEQTEQTETISLEGNNFKHNKTTSVGNNDAKPVLSTFHHVFLDANKEVLKASLDGSDNVQNHSEFDTGRGRALSHFIEGTRLSMGLTETIGCSGGHYRLDLPPDDPRSLWGLYVREVIPHSLANNHSRIFIQRTRALRYDMLVGPITVDDAISISPMGDRMIRIMDKIDKKDLLMLLNKLDVSGMDELRPNLPKYGISPSPYPIHSRQLYTFELYGMEQDWPHVQAALAELALDHNESFFSTIAWEDYEPEVYRGGTSGTSVQTSHGVWVHFVEDNWKCVTPENDVDFKINKQLLIWLCILTSLMGLAHYYSWLNSNDRISTDRSRAYIRMAGATGNRSNVLTAKSVRRKQHQQNVIDQYYKNLKQQQEKNDSQPTESTAILSGDGEPKSAYSSTETRPSVSAQTA